jgi:hypothetical protein
MLRLTADIPDDLADQAERWLRRAVGCLFGRVHCHKDRFALASVSNAAELAGVRRAFGDAICTQGLLSCLVLIEPGNNLLRAMPIERLVRYLDRKYFTATDSRRRDIPIVSGAAYSISYTITCPVTSLAVLFTDFDQVAFYPQAADEDDPLYDPSMFAPFVCINITSDAYAFALTCADRSEILTQRPVRELSAAERSEVYDAALKAFQRLAEQSIAQYHNATNPDVADPIHLSDDRQYYIAPHDEAAFAETAKRLFRSEMPVLYAPRIIEEWERCFATGAAPDMTDVYLPAIPVER